jgi:hypothetical protein
MMNLNLWYLWSAMLKDLNVNFFSKAHESLSYTVPFQFQERQVQFYHETQTLSMVTSLEIALWHTCHTVMQRRSSLPHGSTAAWELSTANRGCRWMLAV